MIASLLRRVGAAILCVVLALMPARAEQASVVLPTSGPHSMADMMSNFINPALRTVLSCSSGPTAPANGPNGAPTAGQCWLDNSAIPLALKYYDGGQWLILANLDAAGHVLSLPNATLSGAPRIPGLTGYVHSPGNGVLTASTTIPTGSLSGFLLAANFPGLSGDVGCPSGSLTSCALATANGAPGTYGDASTVPVVTVDAKGRVTGVVLRTVVAPAGTLTGDTLAAGVTKSSLATFAAGAALNDLAAKSVDNSKLAAGTSYANLDPNSVDPPKMTKAPKGTLRGNMAGADPDVVSDNTLKAYMAAAFGSTPGTMLCYDSTNGWTLVPAATGAGQVPVYGAAGSCPTPQSPAAAAAQPRSAVRQTVQGGPQSGGLPIFLPQTSSNLNLTAQNVGTGANALTVAAAQGYNTTGQNDIISQLTSNPTWSSLTASTTVYLWINAQTGATGATTLPPIYQFGGTISTANGQFTFDRQAMIGYLGNGTSAVATPLVFVGQATTSASAVTSTVAYAYNGTYQSTVQAFPTSTTPLSVNHNLGVTPATWSIGIVFLTAYANYNVNDQITYNDFVLNGSPNNRQLYGAVSASAVQLIVGTQSLLVINKNGSTYTAVTPANNGVIFYASRGW